MNFSNLLLKLSFGIVLLVVPFASGKAQDDAVEQPAPAAKRLTTATAIQAALQKKLTIDFSGQGWSPVLKHLQDKTGIRFINQTRRFADEDVIPGPGFRPRQFMHLQVKNETLADGLQRFLSKHRQTYVVLSDRVVVTSPSRALPLQMRQIIQVNVRNEPLDKAITSLAGQTAINLVIDPQVAKRMQAPVTLRLKNVTVETGIRLLAFVGGLRSVRVGNVVVVTSEERAKQLPAETPLQRGFSFPDGFEDPPVGVPGFQGGGAVAPPGIPQAVPGAPGGAPVPPDTPVQSAPGQRGGRDVPPPTVPFRR